MDYEPDLVVQPENKEEIKELVELAKREEIPIVPRGSGTSALGGSVPASGGISISFVRMRGIEEIDEEQNKVRVLPGTIWANPVSTDMTNIDKPLNAQLKEHGFEVLAYPSSAPGSTVAGWVAEGGAGYGSYEYGEIRDIVSEIELISPNGKKRLSGKELDYVVGLEGTTGIISEIELDIKPREEKITKLIAFDESNKAIEFLKATYEEDLSFWNLTLHNPNYTKKNQEATHNYKLPSDKWFVSANYPANREIDSLESLVEEFDGELLNEELADYAWEQRFSPLRYKRIGPSEIASESYVPLKNFESYIDSLKEIDEDFILDTKLIKGGETYNLASVTTDERAPSYMVSAMTQMQFDDAAKNANGSLYGIGIYNHSDAPNHFGENRFEEIKQFKQEVDEKEIMNPGKVFSPKKRAKGVKNIQRMMKLAKIFTPLKGVASFFLSNKPKIKKDKDFQSLLVPEEIDYESFACSRCNYCTEVCTKWSGSKWESQSPKGRWAFLRQYLQGNEEWDQEIAETFLLCTTCKRCNEVCQSDIPNQELYDEIRGPLIEDKGFATFSGFEMMKATADINNNIWAGREEDRDNWLPKKEGK